MRAAGRDGQLVVERRVARAVVQRRPVAGDAVGGDPVLGLLDARGGGAAVGRREVDLDRAVVRVARRRSGGVERRRRGRGDDLAVDRVRGDPDVVDLRRCRACRRRRACRPCPGSCPRR